MSGWAQSRERMNSMNCEQFQEVLPHIIESGGNAAEEAHLSSCQACGELVRDLRYIAEQAKLLLPMRDPNPRVWNNIQESLQREGLVREGRMSRLGHINTAATTQKKNWTPLGTALAATAVLALAVLLVNYHPSAPANQETLVPATAQESSAAATSAADDQVLVRQLSQRDPDVGRAYETSLREVNSYISDAEQAVNDNPGDAVAQQHLIDAYEQKAMLYQMATARALE